MSTLNKRQFLSLSALTAFLPMATQAFGKTANTDGKKPLIYANLNENPFGASPSVKQAITEQLGQLGRYSDPAAAEKLIQQIATLENIDPDQIILGEILDSLGLFLAASKPNQGNVVYSVPGYTALVDAGKPAGLTSIAVPLNQALENDLPALEKAITPYTKAVYLVNPHNPSGTTNNHNDFAHFLRQASQKTLVIVDEAYLEYADSAQTAAAFTKNGANIAVFRTLDKIYGLAGLPIGYLLAPKALASSLREAGFGNSHGLSRLTIAAASAALSDQKRRQTLHDYNAKGRTRLTQALDQLKLTHTASQTNFVFFKSPRPAAEVREKFYQSGIVVARSFPPLNDWIRLSIGTEDEVTQIIAALNQIF
ncbi:MAG: histidinol-phosphate transaminase [Zymomonas mobilis]|uniref:Histidinol-phosphate aminotransferase n=1 Tax=Zymomonas mobilis TaxID=542 RepID=A0A542VZ48_ZYMMB|nr:histidinol-phosphate transaminase [Zymomonas mobilis]TQL16601.1 histidinol-phosphate aminotransferase [Zymomonas mobilis]